MATQSADALKRLEKARKSAEAFHAIVGSVFGAILSFLGKVVGFVAEGCLFFFLRDQLGEWLIQKFKN